MNLRHAIRQDDKNTITGRKAFIIALYSTLTSQIVQCSLPGLLLDLLQVGVEQCSVEITEGLYRVIEDMYC